MISPKPVLAILGGAGHQAAARLHQALLDRFSGHAVHDAHYPDMLLINRSIDGVGLEGVEDDAAADACLRNRLDQARAAGATHCLLACASLHSLSSSRDCLDWMSLGARRLAATGTQTVGVIASSSARSSRLFEQLLSPYGIATVHHHDQTRADRLIAQCLSGKLSPSGRDDFVALHADLRLRTDRVWRACTELSAITCSGAANELDLCSLDLMLDTALVALEDVA